MYHNIFWNYHTAQYNLATLIHRLDFFLRNLRWILRIQCVCSYHNRIDPVARCIFYLHPYILNRRFPRKDVNRRNRNIPISRGLHTNRIFGIWLLFRRFHRIFEWRRIKCKFFTISGIIRTHLLNCLRRISRIRYGNFCSLYRRSVRFIRQMDTQCSCIHIFIYILIQIHIRPFMFSHAIVCRVSTMGYLKK